MATAFEDAADHCDELVRSEDKDRWLTALFVPEERRPLIHALYAFNAELARVRDQVSQPMLGEIRLQWWDDAVAQLSVHMRSGVQHGAEVGTAFCHLTIQVIRDSLEWSSHVQIESEEARP